MSKFGPAMAAGDVNGDGFSDVILCGREVYIFYGGSGGLAPDPIALKIPGSIWATIGTADVNGDGFDDIVAGAQAFLDEDDDNIGRVVALHGSPTGPDGVLDWEQEGPPEGFAFGDQVLPIGDIDGDGHDDVIDSGMARGLRVLPGGRPHRVVPRLPGGARVATLVGAHPD